MSETSEALPPPEVVEKPVEIPPLQADTAPVSESPQELPPLPEALPEFDDTQVEAPEADVQEQAGDAPSEATDTSAEELIDESQESAGEAPPEFDDTIVEAPNDGGQEQASDAPPEATDTSGEEVIDEPLESAGEAPPELDDTIVEAPDDGGQEQASDAPPEATDASAEEVIDESPESAGEAPPELDDTIVEAPDDGGQEQASDAPPEATDTSAEELTNESQESAGEAPSEFDDTIVEAADDGGQEQAGDASPETTDTSAEELTDESQESAGEAVPELDDTVVEAPDDGGQEQAGDASPETTDTSAEELTDESQESAGEAPPDSSDAEDDQAELTEDDQNEPAQDEQTETESDLAESEAEQIEAEADEAESALDDQAEAKAQAATDAAEHPQEDRNEEPIKREDDDTDDENSGDPVREHDKQPPAVGADGDFARAETDTESPCYEKELMDLEVAESRELCRRIGDSYQTYDQSDLERRDDGSLFFEDYQVELTSQGDAFGSYKDLQRWIGDHGMAGSRKDGCPYLEAHHLIPAAECREAGLNPDLAPCVAVQNDLHIAMLHGSAGLVNRPEFSSIERMRTYYEGFYDGLNAAAWARRAGDYLQSHHDAFKTTLGEWPAASVPIVSTTREIAEIEPESRSAGTEAVAQPEICQSPATDAVTDVPPEYTRMKEVAEAALYDSRMEKSIDGPLAYHETTPGEFYVRIVPVDPEQGLDEASFDINHIWGKPEATMEGTSPEIAERNAQIDARNARLEAANAELKAKTEALFAERVVENPSWTEVEAARVILGERASAGEWWVSLESYGQIHEHWATTSREDSDYTLTDAFRDKMGLDTKWSPLGYDQTMLVKTDFPVPCAAGMGNIYHRHLEITGEEKHGPTGIEQIFIPRSTAESLFHRGCYTTFQDPKQLTLDQLKQMKDA
jgi:hypothetical protein